MTLLTADAVARGRHLGQRQRRRGRQHSDNNIAAFRFKFAKTKMQAAEEDFDADGHHFRAGAIIIADANRAQLEPALKQLGLSAYAMASAPSVKTHDLDVPRIGYVHSWSRTQDEGWVRAALDTYGIPYSYFGDIDLRKGNLRQKYDVIIFPHIGGTVQSDGERHCEERRDSASVQEDRGVPGTRHARRVGRHSRRDGSRRREESRRVRASRAER